MTETPKDLSLEELIKLGEHVNFWEKISPRKIRDELTYEIGYRGSPGAGVVMELSKMIYGSVGCSYKISAFKEFSEGNSILGSAGHDEEILKDFYDEVNRMTDERIKQKLDTEKYSAIVNARYLIRHKVSLF
ncbi:MAG: hypothetical protein AABY07_03060 [Nanoarchaeota archaeon]